LQKNLGKKRFYISNNGAKDILDIYRNYDSCSRDIVYDKTGEVEHIEIAKLLDYDDFLYTTVTTHRPLRLWYENVNSKYEALCADENFNPEDKKNAILKEVIKLGGIDVKRNDKEFFELLKDNKVKTTAAQIKLLRSTLGTISEDAPEVFEKPLDSNSGFAIDANLNDTEKIPMKQDIDEYFQREVLPFAPDAWMEREKDKIGCEFPFTRIFYIYRPLRSTQAILDELMALDGEMENELKSLKEEE